MCTVLAKYSETMQKYRVKGDLKQFLQYHLSLQCYVPLFLKKFGQQVFAIISFLIYQFINAHLQQRDQVVSLLHTVDFWLIVCWNSRVLAIIGL